jgi:ADP-ribose pyrophosphatase
MPRNHDQGARRLSRTVPYDGRIFRVERDVVTLPHGRRATMEVVRHRGSVVLVPQPALDRVVLIRQYRYVINRWIWELPAGSLEPGEAPARAARRECEEEIGLTPTRLRRLGTFYPTPGFCDEKMIFYRCDGLRTPRVTPARDEDEQIEPRTFTLRAAWRLVERGRIIDMKTILGLVLIEKAARIAGAVLPLRQTQPGPRLVVRRRRR